MIIEIKIDTGDKFNSESIAKLVQEAKLTVNDTLGKCEGIVKAGGIKAFDKDEYNKGLFNNGKTDK